MSPTIKDIIIERWKARKKHVSEWASRKGKKDYLDYLSGEMFSPRKHIAMKCYDCLCGGDDGADSLDCQVYECPLYPYNPWQKTIAPPKKKMKGKDEEDEQ